MHLTELVKKNFTKLLQNKGLTGLESMFVAASIGFSSLPASAKVNEESDVPARRYEEEFDDDTNLDFVWTAAEGSFEYYNIYVSVDGVDDGEYNLYGTTTTESCRINAQENKVYRVKVAAVLGSLEGPHSPESDRVIADLTPPSTPVISGYEQVRTPGDNIEVNLHLSEPSTDIHFSNYEVKGGPYADWTATSENHDTGFKFVFPPQYAGQYTLEIRGRDRATNSSNTSTIEVDIDPRNSENPTYWEYEDRDLDDLPDWWELKHFKNLSIQNAEGDPDRDGLNNFKEYITGTNPQDPESYFSAEISRDNEIAEVIHVSCLGVPGTMYQFYCSNDLKTWKLLGDPIFPNNYEKVEQRDMNVNIPPATEKYYRIEAIKYNEN